MKPRLANLFCCLALFGSSGCASTAPAPIPERNGNAALWGAEALGQIHSGFYLPEQHLYGNEIGPGRGKPHPAFVWHGSVQLAALAAAARVEPRTYLPQLKEYAAALRTYRTDRNGIVGADVLPAPKPPDRYYDDNAWVALAMVETYQLTHDPADLAFAKEALQFCLSGEDAKLGGGIYWHEDRYQSKHTCSSAPTSAAALELYRVTCDGRYLDTGRRLYSWTKSRLQDADGLYSDSISVADGKVQRAKYAYNTALMIRSACLLYAITRDHVYLKEAQRVARAAEAHWVRASDGASMAESKFAHKLAEAFLSVYDADRDPHWLAVVGRAVRYVHEHCRDPMGWYASRWDARDPPSLDPIGLVDQASAARAYWVASRYPTAMAPSELSPSSRPDAAVSGRSAG